MHSRKIILQINGKMSLRLMQLIVYEAPRMVVLAHWKGIFRDTASPL